MYYADLVQYTYGHTIYKDALNIGWLEKGHDFPMGYFPEKREVLEKLKVKKPENLYRDWHCSKFCEPDNDFVNKFNPSQITNPNFIEREKKELYIGNGEYIVKWNEKTYASSNVGYTLYRST